MLNPCGVNIITEAIYHRGPSHTTSSNCSCRHPERRVGAFRRDLASPTLDEAIYQLSVYFLSWDKSLPLERAGSPLIADRLLPLIVSAMLSNEIVDMMLG